MNLMNAFTNELVRRRDAAANKLTAAEQLYRQIVRRAGNPRDGDGAALLDAIELLKWPVHETISDIENVLRADQAHVDLISKEAELKDLTTRRDAELARSKNMELPWPEREAAERESRRLTPFVNQAEGERHGLAAARDQWAATVPRIFYGRYVPVESWR